MTKCELKLYENVITDDTEQLDPDDRPDITSNIRQMWEETV